MIKLKDMSISLVHLRPNMKVGECERSMSFHYVLRFGSDFENIIIGGAVVYIKAT